MSGNIYTSTEYPANQSIFLHNEQSYNLQFPLKIYFCCLEPPASGGETPLADCRRVYARLSDGIIRQFDDGYRYVRNFGTGPGLSWQEAFQTTERSTVEQYCRTYRIAYEWHGVRLRTWQIRRAFARHPRSGEMVWFNHLTFFNLSTLPEPIQSVLRQEYPLDLPNQTYHADGREIAAEVLHELRAAYAAETTMFPWHRGDVLMLDNMMVAHGRQPFVGPRRVVVGMSETIAWDDVASGAVQA